MSRMRSRIVCFKFFNPSARFIYKDSIDLRNCSISCSICVFFARAFSPLSASLANKLSFANKLFVRISSLCSCKSFSSARAFSFVDKSSATIEAPLVLFCCLTFTATAFSAFAARLESKPVPPQLLLLLDFSSKPRPIAALR